MASKSITVETSQARLQRWQQRFLTRLRETPNVKAACIAAGVSRQTAYRTRSTNKAFAEAWREAIDAALDDLEATAFCKAKEGDASLITWLLRCHRPEVYRERQEVAVAGGIVFLPMKSPGDE